MKKLIAIDGNALLFRAYFATAVTGNVMRASNGIATNGLRGFINMVNKIQDNYPSDYMIVAWDASSKNFRKEKYSEYKGTRGETDQDLIDQFPLVREYLDYLGIPQYEIEGYEADDIIGTLAALGNKEGIEVDVVTSDKDMLQLLTDKVNIIMPQSKSQDYKLMTVDNLKDVWDIKPLQVIDLKGLSGDPSDNIPGVKGVGDKTAVKLINEYGSVENIYENIDKIKGKLQEKLITDKDNAFMSKELATIITDVPLPFNLEDCHIKEENEESLKDFYYRYDMNQLLNRKAKAAPVKDEVKYSVVDKMPKEVLVDGNFFSFVSLEENYHFGNIIGGVLANKEQAYFIDYEHLKNDEDLLTYLKTNKKIAYDGKANICLGAWHNIQVSNIIDDLMLGCYVIDVDKDNAENGIVDTNFDVRTPSNKDLLKKSLEEIIQVKCTQAYYLLQLNDKYHQMIQSNNLQEVYDLEMAVMSILADLEMNGILVDKNELEIQTKDFDTKVTDLESKIKSYVPDEDFNVNSPGQLATVLFETLNIPYPNPKAKKFSTSVDILNELYDAHPIIPLILEYRTYKKLLSTYLQSMPPYIKEDGRVHTIYRQAFTATGRLSSADPNLQNIATKSDVQKQVKKIFVAKEGYTLLSFDYSQIELRVLASLSNDPVFVKSYQDNEDIHALTASKVLDKDIKDITKQERDNAKATNFGIIYGLSAFGLAKQLNIPVEEADSFIKKFYQAYPSIHDYLNGLVEDAKKTGATHTILNRVRYIKDINSNNFRIRENANRQAMNTPIQGSAADIMKLAMVKVYNQLQSDNYDIKMLLQVHDELIFEVKSDQVEAVIPTIKKAMEDAYKLKVHLDVDYDYGHSWYDL